MNNKRAFIAAATTLIVAFSVAFVPLAYAQTTISKPSVPEFVAKLIDSSYDVPTTYSTDPYTGKNTTTPGYHVQILNIELSIKNQPFQAYHNSGSNSDISLYYDIRAKGYFENNWSQLFRYPPQSNSEYTVISIPAQYPSGGQVDFQVKAFIGNMTHVLQRGERLTLPAPGRPDEYRFYYQDFWSVEAESDWSETQTIAISEPLPSLSPSPTLQPTTEPTQSASPTAAPTGPSDALPVTLGVAAVVLSTAAVIIALLGYFRKPNKEDNKKNE